MFTALTCTMLQFIIILEAEILSARKLTSLCDSPNMAGRRAAHSTEITNNLTSHLGNRTLLIKCPGNDNKVIPSNVHCMLITLRIIRNVRMVM